MSAVDRNRHADIYILWSLRDYNITPNNVDLSESKWKSQKLEKMETGFWNQIEN